MNIAVTRALALSLALIPASNAQSPIQIPWSNRTYGPDGPWHAITVQIGTPPQAIDLFPASPGVPNILSSDYCQNYSLPGCTTTPNYFNQNASQSYDATWYQNTTGSPVWELPLNCPGHLGSVTDIFSIPVDYQPPLTFNVSMRLTTDGQVFTGVDGFSSYYTLGTLGLGSTMTAVTPDGATAPYIGNYSANYAFQNASRIPSASFAIHCGSVVAGVPPSLHFGGYDRSRVVGQSISTTFRGDDAIIGLKDISIGSFYGPSPWNFSNNVQSGFLQTNISNGQKSDVILPTYIGPDQPFMVLPPETCDAIASQLPVAYDSSRQLYFWDTENSSYSAIVNGPHYISFNLTDPGSTDADSFSPGDIEIKVPFKALNLTLDTTIQQPSVPPRQYLPCYHYDRQDWVQWRLGRAFLQAAYFVGNWVPHAPVPPGAPAPVSGGWSLAQAPGPDVKLPDLQALSSQDYTIQSGYATDELAATWGFAPTPPTPPPPPAASLSPGARAGVAVGVIVAVVAVAATAVYVVRRRRRLQAQRVAALACVAESSCDGKAVFGSVETALLDSREVVEELPVRRDEAQELPDNGVSVPYPRFIAGQSPRKETLHMLQGG